MREIRPYGSEAGEPHAPPTPIIWDIKGEAQAGQCPSKGLAAQTVAVEERRVNSTLFSEIQIVLLLQNY